MPPDPQTTARLLAHIAESDAIIAALRTDAVDPVDLARLAEAYRRRALALNRLERWSRALTDWDRLLRILARREADDTARDAYLAEALDHKAFALRRVGRIRDARALDAEIVERFGASPGAGVGQRVDAALMRRAGELLDRPADVAEALALSDRLIERFAVVPEEALARSVELLLHHARALISVYPGPLAACLRAPVEIAVNGGTDVVELLAGAVDPLLPVPALAGLAGLIARRTPMVLLRHRRRQAQALAVLEAVERRLGSLGEDADPELSGLRRRARFYAGCAMVFLGRPAQGHRAIRDTIEGSDPAAVGTLSDMATELASQTGWFGQLNAASLLRLRALALVGEDPQLARLAYDDSVVARLPADRPALVRLWIRALRPGATAPLRRARKR